MTGVTTLAGLLAFISTGLTLDWVGAKIRLGTNTLTPSRGTVVGDLTEATFLGYVAKTVAWGTPFFNPTTGMMEAVGTAVYEWIGPTDNSGQVIRSWMLEQPGAAGPPLIAENVLSSGNLSVPITLNVPTDGLALTVRIDGSGTVSVEFAN